MKIIVFYKLIPIILYLLMFTTNLSAKLNRISGKEKQDLIQLLEIKNDSILFHVFYIFDKNFCARCYNAEIHNGWLNTPDYFKKYIHINFITNNKNLSKYLHKNDTNMYSISVYRTKKIKKLKKYLNKAILYVQDNKNLFSYKIASNDFQVLYRYFDSVLFKNKYFLKKNNLKLIKKIPTEIPNNINSLTISYSLNNNTINLYSAEYAILWNYNISGKFKSKFSMSNLIKLNNNNLSYYHDKVISFYPDSIIYTNSVLLSQPLDTVSFNRPMRRWRKYESRILVLNLKNNKHSVNENSIIRPNGRIGTFTKSNNNNIIWGCYILSNKDTAKGIFDLFYIFNGRTKEFELPLRFYSSNPEYTSSFNTYLFTLNPYGLIFRIDTNKKTSSIPLSYYKNDKRLLTFFDGQNYSITSHNSEYAYLVVYNKYGIRKFNFTNYQFYSYYLYLTKDNTIIEITKDKRNWTINIYRLRLI